MADSASSDRHHAGSELAGLPAALAQQSLAPTRLILPKDAALEALELLATQGRVLENWEGWIKLGNGSRVKSLTHAGSFALARDATRAAQAARAGIEAAQRRWDRDPEYPNATLYFQLTFASAT